MSPAPASRLVVVRHAKSDYPWGVDDHDRPLNDRGRRDAPRLGEWLDAHLPWADGHAPLVLVSSALRAQLTWALARAAMSDRWEQATVEDEARIYEAPVSVLRDVATAAAARADTVVLVGHNPGLAGLVLTMAVDDERRREATAKFPTSAVAVLESDRPLPEAVAEPGRLRVSAFAVPRG